MTQPLRPPRLQCGMTIGVVAPSSALRDERLARGVAALEARGYRVVAGDHLYDRHGYLAGPDAGRAADLNAMFARDDVDAIFCARGGYGCWRLVDSIDWEAVRRRPKVFVGYSDVTTLHLGMERHADVVSIHGPMVVTHGGGLSPAAEECFWRTVERVEPAGAYDLSGGEAHTLVGGTAKGRLAGGCISLLAAAAGTPESPDFSGRVVVLEDIGEAAYRIDRHLHQLLRSCRLGDAAGFVVGAVTDWKKDEDALKITMEDVWRELLAPLGKPTIVGFPFGHEPNPLTIPLGCRAVLDADACRLEVLEAAVL